MEDRQRKLEQECKERNAQSKAYIAAHYGNSYGPRRRHHWEARAGQQTLVEE